MVVITNVCTSALGIVPSWLPHPYVKYFFLSNRTADDVKTLSLILFYIIQFVLFPLTNLYQWLLFIVFLLRKLHSFESDFT